MFTRSEVSKILERRYQHIGCQNVKSDKITEKNAINLKQLNITKRAKLNKLVS